MFYNMLLATCVRHEAISKWFGEGKKIVSGSVAVQFQDKTDICTYWRHAADTNAKVMGKISAVAAAAAAKGNPAVANAFLNVETALIAPSKNAAASVKALAEKLKGSDTLQKFFANGGDAYFLASHNHMLRDKSVPLTVDPSDVFILHDGKICLLDLELNQ